MMCGFNNLRFLGSEIGSSHSTANRFGGSKGSISMCGLNMPLDQIASDFCQVHICHSPCTHKECGSKGIHKNCCMSGLKMPNLFSSNSFIKKSARGMARSTIISSNSSSNDCSKRDAHSGHHKPQDNRTSDVFDGPCSRTLSSNGQSRPCMCCVNMPSF